jgi:HD superfamily phosphodiesterase
MLPTKEEAEFLLQQGFVMNPGPWMEHSCFVADCAKKVAMNCDDLDPGKAYIVGLLHDIGRRFGVTHLAHVIDGYHFLLNLGYDEAAKICITHSFAIKDIHTYIGITDVPKEEYCEIAKLIIDYTYDDYDRLIQLCDSIAMVNGIADLKARMDDVEKRYGYYPENKRKEHFKIKDYFESRMGISLTQAINKNEK